MGDSKWTAMRGSSPVGDEAPTADARFAPHNELPDLADIPRGWPIGALGRGMWLSRAWMVHGSFVWSAVPERAPAVFGVGWLIMLSHAVFVITI